jgi:hypothetical protein
LPRTRTLAYGAAPAKTNGENCAAVSSGGPRSRRDAPMAEKQHARSGHPSDLSEPFVDCLHQVGTNPSQHHRVEVAQEPAPGHGNQIVNLVAVCTCGWRSAEHQLHLGASTSWAKDRARRQLENAGSSHIRSLSGPSA